MAKSYVNAITTHEVSMAIEKFLIAAYPQAFTPERVDVGSPPSGFLDLGAVVEDTPSISISRGKYELQTGIPKVTQYQVVTEMSAEISFSLYTNSWWQAQFMLGNETTITTVTTIASGTIKTQYIGKATLASYALLGVADFINGSQLIHEFTKVKPSGDWTEEVRPDDANAMQMTFDAMGLQTWVSSDCQELVLGKRHYLNGDGEVCAVDG